MLSPFKTFLNNLQKNAGATIFGLSSAPPDSNANTTATTTSSSSSAEAAAPNDESTSEASAMSATSRENIPHPYHHPHEPSAASDRHDPVAVTAYVPTPTSAEPQPQPQLDSTDAAVVEFYTDDDQLSQPLCDDPLSDPLALEDNNAGGAAETSGHGASTQITLVDVSRLRCAVDEMAQAQQGASATMEQLQFDAVVAEIAGLSGAAGSAEDGGGSSGLEEAGARSDGSDSGLGLESSTSSSITTTLTTCGAPELTPTRSGCAPASARQPLRTALKRRSNSNTSPTSFAEDCENLLASSDPTTTALTSPASSSSAAATAALCSVAKRAKRHIHFNDVTVYYFQRQQGFMCVPSQGGCSLGMAATHMYRRRFSLAEYAAEQRRVQRHKAQELKRSAGLPVSSSEDSAGGSDDDGGTDGGPTGSTSPAVAALLLGTSPAEAAASAAAASSDSDDDNESQGIQPVSARQRRVLLKAAGVRKIDASEKKECRAILVSRDNCGCNCRGYCDPELCACAQSGIKCQVDRLHYPCGCSRDGCGNPVGRGEFNKARVKTHYIHTFLRLQLESKPVVVPVPVMVVPVAVPVPLPVIPPLLPAMRSAVSAGGGWHSQVGRSLAAMSGDNLYNMNGAAATIPALPLVHADLQLDTAGADLLYPFAVDDDAFDGAAQLTLDAGVGAAAAGLAGGSGSGLNTPTNICGSSASTVASAFAVLSSASAAASAMYSPDSATIVEPVSSASRPEAEVLSSIYPPPKYLQPSPATSAYAEYGTALGQNQITGYQHSYLYSLQQLQQHRQDYLGEASDPQSSSSSHTAPTTTTGYQHSYLYSLMPVQKSRDPSSPQHNLQLQPPSPQATASTSAAAAAAAAAYSSNPCDSNPIVPQFDVSGYSVPFQAAAATTTFDHLLLLEDQQTVVAAAAATITGQPTIADHDLEAQRRLSAASFEPIDFESELDSSFIDKSLKQCVSPAAAIESARQLTNTATTNGHHPLLASEDDEDDDEYVANGVDVHGLVLGQ